MAATTVPLPDPPKGAIRAHHSRDLALQKYLLLQEQRELLRQHLDSLRPSLQTSMSAISNTTSNSPVGSPTDATYPSPSYSSTQTSSPYQSRSSSLSRGVHNSNIRNNNNSNSNNDNNNNNHVNSNHNHHHHHHHQPHHRRATLPAVALGPRAAATSCTVPVAATSLEITPDEAMLSHLAAEEAKLCDINEGIKRALTELLNCQAVRTDRAFRTWVQCRLMDTERELRSGRRRRSAPEP